MTDQEVRGSEATIMSDSRTADAAAGEPPETTGKQPFRVRLPGFVSDTEVGLGDVIKRATTTVGVPPCGGCSRRAAALNRRVAFSPWRRP